MPGEDLSKLSCFPLLLSGVVEVLLNFRAALIEDRDVSDRDIRDFLSVGNCGDTERSLDLFNCTFLRENGFDFRLLVGLPEGVT